MPAPPAFTELDRTRLAEALRLAERAIGVSDPNPRVGCIVGHADGRVLGRGSTQRAGDAHAEAMALRDAAAAGHDVRGATAWVTLEPCAHHGRTPPCCDALVAAGIGRVVCAIEDPFPQVAGAGLARLRAAGVEVVVAPDDVAAAARELNVGWFARLERGRPWVRLKVAASLDGRTALPDGTSQWITGADARADGHRWRRRAGAIVTGIGTVLADDPRLDARLAEGAERDADAGTPLPPPLRVVVDSAARTPRGARLLAPPGEVWIVTAAAAVTPTLDGDRAGRPGGREPATPAGGFGDAAVRRLPSPDRRVDLAALCDALAAHGVNEIHVEAGTTLNTAFLRAGLVDELLLYVAPRLLGPGRGIVEWPALQRIDDGIEWRIVDTAMVGSGLRLRLRPCR